MPTYIPLTGFQIAVSHAPIVVINGHELDSAELDLLHIAVLQELTVHTKSLCTALNEPNVHAQVATTIARRKTFILLEMLGGVGVEPAYAYGRNRVDINDAPVDPEMTQLLETAVRDWEPHPTDEVGKAKQRTLLSYFTQ